MRSPFGTWGLTVLAAALAAVLALEWAPPHAAATQTTSSARKRKHTKPPTPATGPAPRVRREWRTLSPATRQRVASAFWVLKNTTTQAGRAKYGANFNNHDEMLMLHACAVKDPRCDQGHFGPQFMTFHRAFLLKYERALLAVDPGIEALPYWNIVNDAYNGPYRNDPDKYIYTSKFFGSLYTDAAKSYAVTDGLFANWPIAVYTPQKFGASSWLAPDNRCVAEEWFSSSPCNSKNAKSTRYLRDHADCTPTLARNVMDNAMNKQGSGLGGSHEIVFSASDFAACHDPRNVRSWMDVQNCIEFAGPFCVGLTPKQVASQAKTVKLNFPPTSFPNCTYNLMGSYVDAKKRLHLVNFFHSMVHLKAGLDLADVTTSPNDPGSFTGHHANVDRLFNIWQRSSAGKASEAAYWKYPTSTMDAGAKGRSSVTTSGPYSLYDYGQCANNTAFDEYKPLSTAWLPGSTLDDVVNAGFAFTNLFDCAHDEVDGQGHPIRCSGLPGGYTHREILYWTAPSRTPYVYDDMVG